MANHELPIDASLPVFPELSGDLKSYTFPKRVEALRSHELAGFIATGHSEVNDAFRALLDHDVSGRKADDRLDSIAEHAQQTAVGNDNQNRAGRTVARITSDHAAYAQQANRDKRWLRFMRHNLLESLEAGEQYGSLAKYVAATGTQAYEGAGQLVRYIDAARYVLKAPLSDGRFTFGAQLSKNSSGKSIVTDSFTAVHPLPIMEQYQREVLSGVSMDVASALLGYAIGNEIARQRFWERDLVESSSIEIARPIVTAALKSLSA